jgi:ASC-1-like (ASCH) protein
MGGKVGLMAMHSMKLQPEPFEKMQAGTKTIELRLNDAKRQGIAVGDTVVFVKEPELAETLVARVAERLEYATFAALRADFPAEMTGGGDGRPAFYSEADEQRYGALGLRIEIDG